MIKYVLYQICNQVDIPLLNRGLLLFGLFKLSELLIFLSLVRARQHF
jgi:hypothetical protein